MRFFKKQHNRLKSLIQLIDIGLDQEVFWLIRYFLKNNL